MEWYLYALMLLGLFGVWLAYHKGAINTPVAVLTIAVICLLVMAGKAEARTSVTIHSGQKINTACVCYKHHFGVTLTRYGIIDFHTKPLWKLQQTMYWETKRRYPPYTHLRNISVRRSYSVGTFWNWGGYVSRSKIRFFSSPDRWWTHVEAAFIGNTASWNNEHNYPDIYTTLHKTDGYVSWTTKCGC